MSRPAESAAQGPTSQVSFWCVFPRPQWLPHALCSLPGVTDRRNRLKHCLEPGCLKTPCGKHAGVNFVVLLEGGNSEFVFLMERKCKFSSCTRSPGFPTKPDGLGRDVLSLAPDQAHGGREGAGRLCCVSSCNAHCLFHEDPQLKAGLIA